MESVHHTRPKFKHRPCAFPVAQRARRLVRNPSACRKDPGLRTLGSAVEFSTCRSLTNSSNAAGTSCTRREMCGNSAARQPTCRRLEYLQGRIGCRTSADSGPWPVHGLAGGSMGGRRNARRAPVSGRRPTSCGFVADTRHALGRLPVSASSRRVCSAPRELSGTDRGMELHTLNRAHAHGESPPIRRSVSVISEWVEFHGTLRDRDGWRPLTSAPQ